VKAVLDTNVLVSGLMSAGGPPGQIIDLIGRGAVRPCVDDRVFGEYETVLLRPRLGLPREEVRALLDAVHTTGEWVVPLPIGVKLPHANDLPFLEVAAEAGAVLVTGNMRHFPRRARGEVVVVGPAGFLDLLSRTP